MRKSLKRIGALAAGAALAMAGVVATAGAAGAMAPRSGVVVVAEQTGADSAGCGAPSAPCKTITKAIGNAHPGDTVLVGMALITSRSWCRSRCGWSVSARPSMRPV